MRAFNIKVFTLGLGLTLATLCASASTPVPSVTTLKVAAPSELPSETFMQEGGINPTTAAMHAQENPPPPASDEPLVVGQALPAYKTMADAASAGVNPLAHAPVLPSRDGSEPLTRSYLSRLTPYAIAAGVFIVVLTGAYVAFTPHFRRVAAE